MNERKITIITINYNNDQGLIKTIDSIENQSDKNFEYIIIDGGSNDNSCIVASTSKKCDVFVSEKDHGIYDAMNKGASKSTCDFIMFINSGDCLRTESIALLNKTLIETNFAFDVYHGILAFEMNGVIKHYRGRTSDILNKGMIEHPTVLMKKSKFKELNGFNMDWKYVADYDLLLRAKQLKSNFHFIESVISNFDMSGVSSASLKAPLESLRLQKHHNCISLSEYVLRACMLKIKRLWQCLR